MSKYVVITTIVIVGLAGSGTAVTLDGSGTQEDPWLIQSLEDFDEFAADDNYWEHGTYTRLETDVNLAERTYTTAVIAPDIVNYNFDFDGTAFSGVFDGNDHKITNMTIDDGGAVKNFLGLLGCIGEEGQISNLGLEGGYVSGDSFIGGLTGYCEGNVYNCYSTSDVNGVDYVGGLVGYITGRGSISDCYSSGSVRGGNVVGGLVGLNFGSVSNCYSNGDVNGVRYVGGLMGLNQVEYVLDCYSTGDVSGNYFVGGLLGGNFDGSVSNCFWDTCTQTHDVTESIGYNKGTAINVKGLPTSEMQTMDTFTDAGWDFINTWDIGENQTYPYLRIYLPSDLNKDGIVNFLDVAITANQWMQEQ